MLSPRRTSVEDSEPAVLRNNGLHPSHRYPSTLHLDVFLVANNASTNETNGIVTTNQYAKTPLNSTSKLSTFSTFSPNHHKSGVDLRYRDDPNPYKVSDIDEFRIQTQNPYKTKSTHQLNAINQIRSNNHNGVIPYYDHEDEGDLNHNADSPLSSPGNGYSSSRSATGLSRLSSTTIRSFSSTQYENDSLKKSYPVSEASQNSGEYEIPDPDYEDADGSTGGSSEELPLPLPPPNPHIGDSSEEYSQLSISVSSNSEGLSPSPLGHHESETRSNGTPIKISEADRHRIECALRGRKTLVYVADVLANLYYKIKPPTSTPAQRPQMSKRISQNDEWDLKYTGVPVVLFDTGETKSRDKRKIQIVLAELSSGLALWKDVVDNLSNYRVFEGDDVVQSPDGSTRPISTFHTMHMSCDHTRMVGFSFDNAESADRFALKVEKLTSDFANISLSGAKSKAKKKEAKLIEKNKAAAAKKYVRPKKSDISQPCGFMHVSSLSPNDKNTYGTLQSFLTPNLSNGRRNSRDIAL